MIKLMLTGALGNDCEVREVGSKKAINFNVAVHHDYKDQDGNKVEKTDWVRLREVTLSYELGKLVKNTFIKQLKIYATGRNLWLSTPYTGIDPETSLFGASNTQGLDYFNMPNTKSYVFGVKLDF